MSQSLELDLAPQCLLLLTTKMPGSLKDWVQVSTGWGADVVGVSGRSEGKLWEVEAKTGLTRSVFFFFCQRRILATSNLKQRNDIWNVSPPLGLKVTVDDF